MEIKDLINQYLFRTATFFQKSLGVYLSGDEIHVFSAEKRFIKIQEQDYKSYLIRERPVGDTLKLIRDDFDAKNALISVYYFNPGSFFKVIEIPQMPEKDIRIWLEENWGHTLKTNIPLSKIIFDYKIIGKENDLILYVYMVNKSEIESQYQQFKSAGLQINYFTLLLESISIEKSTSNQHGIINLKEGAYDFYIKREKILIYFNQIPKAIHKGETDPVRLISLINQLYTDDLNLLDFHCNSESLTIKNYELMDDRQRAKQIAVSSLTPSESVLRMAPVERQKKTDEYLWKQSALKSTLVFGGFFLLIYIIAFVLNISFMTLQSGLQEELDALAPDLVRLESIRHQVRVKDADLKEVQRMKARRSQTAAALEAVSAHIPADCWLINIHFDSKSDGLYNGYILGMSKDRQKVNSLLNCLEDDPNFTKTNMDYVKNIESDYLYRTWKVRASNYLEFKMSYRLY